MVPGTGIEPVRSFDRGILSPLCLPISPPGRGGLAGKTYRDRPEQDQREDKLDLEAGVGIEPAYAELQSAA
jgi:hypothetical protein